MRRRSKRLTRDIHEEEAAMIPVENFLAVMNLLVKERKGVDLGPLSLIAISKLNKALREKASIYVKDPAYWTMRFKRDLVPLLSQSITEQNQLIHDWNTQSAEPSFYLFMAYAICRLMPDTTFTLLHKETQHTVTITLAFWKSRDGEYQILESATYTTFSPQTFTFFNNGRRVTLPPRMLSPFADISGIAIDPVPIVYDALRSGWILKLPENFELPEEIQSSIMCSACGEKSSTLLLCGGCAKATYCNDVCQRKDWHNHSQACNWKK